ncbi:bcl2-associated agonist of cell death-like isoform X2 [Amia ocellicauda]
MTHMFSISDDSDKSDDVTEYNQSEGVTAQTKGAGLPLDHSRSVPVIKTPGEGRVRLLSESQASEAGQPDPDTTPFRARSLSAPPALWAARRYGRELRRMSDEFDICLDRGEIKRASSAGTARQMRTSPSWWTFLWSHREGALPEHKLADPFTSSDPVQ